MNRSTVEILDAPINHRSDRQGMDEEECGRQVIRSGRIIGGDDAYQGEFPWTVS